MSTDCPITRIFVTDHKDAERPQSEILRPVQVGPGLVTNRFADTLHDDDGENISHLNPYYCELTTQYWAWKNVDADYYGFCHYRRYFDFATEEHQENDWGEVMAGRIDARACERFGLSDRSIAERIAGYDIVTTRWQDVRRFPDASTNPRTQYDLASELRVEDFDFVMNLVVERDPGYREDVAAFIAGHTQCFCNMFIMRRNLFRTYCEWLFPLLDAWMAQADLDSYSQEGQRTPGHLAERLLNVFVRHQLRVDPRLCCLQLQCVHFEYPEKPPVLEPAFGETEAAGEAEEAAGAAGAAEAMASRAKPAVPIVLAANDGYVPQLTVTIRSLLEHADPERLLDIVVLHQGITPEHQRVMQEFLVGGRPRASLRFADVGSYVAGAELVTNNEHISAETYYRFLIQDVLPGYSKVLYLDADLIVLGDVTRLFDMELGDDLLAAAHDIDFAGQLNFPNHIRLDYALDTLHLRDPYGYFQAGVLLLNTRELRRLHTVGEWMQIVSGSEYIYDDQDVLNEACQGRVRYLGFEWNFTHNAYSRASDVYHLAPPEIEAAYHAAEADPQIIHYAGGVKPWNDSRCDRAWPWWEVARETPFYEELLERPVRQRAEAAAKDAREVEEAKPANQARRAAGAALRRAKAALGSAKAAALSVGDRI